MVTTTASLLGTYGFQAVGRGTTNVFRDPDLSAYSKQKSLPLVGETHDDLSSLDGYNWLDASVGASDVPRYLVRIWDHFYSRRVSAALECDGGLPRILSLFPGNTVLSRATDEKFRYRGSLAFEQFLQLFDYSKGSPSDGLGSIGLMKTAVDETPYWPWANIEKPKLQFITADYEHGAVDCRTDNELTAAKQEYLKQLYSLAFNAINAKDSAPACLKLIHSVWTDTPAPVYSKFAIAVVSRLIEQARPRLNERNLLPFLFELESFAGYETYVSRIMPVASGWYSNTWLDVGFMPLSQIRATELCVPERLIQELLNLPARGFAPVVVNEFDSVADGNHRVTSSWIWNILKHAIHTEWSLDNHEFQLAVRDYVSGHREALGQVSLYESLKQLAAFLADSNIRHQLSYTLKPMMRRTRAIRKLPVVMLPEYAMGTVEKGSYDQSGVLMRVPPSLYSELALSSDLVLPARASYHFTDAVPMPWFEVVKQDRFTRTENHGTQSSGSRRNHSVSRELLFFS
ncbi:hypothetical protein KF728_17070 [Candidatus Obscuribacterales bacterium]|nr:hypothetical protein [Candidatus Obscuribacterales bacterium]